MNFHQILRAALPFAAAAALGVMLMLAFAPFYIFPFAVLAPAGLLALINHASIKRAFWLGYAFGLGLFGSGVYWVFISISRFGDVNYFLSALITAALIAFLAIYPASACYATNRYFNDNEYKKLTLAFPCVWVLSEWVRSWLFTGFPWLLIGYSQTNSPLKGFAPILGVYGISLALMVTSGLIVSGIYALRRADYFRCYISLFIIVIIWGAGSLFSLIPWTEPSGAPVKFTLVQGNIPQSIKWDPDNVALSLNTYRTLSSDSWGKANIIIWPESAIPLPVSDARFYLDEMAQNAITSNTTLIFGIPSADSDSTGYYNTLVAMGRYNAAYRKRLLVPFGEYVPFQKLFARAFDFMNVPMSNTIPGLPHQPPLQIGDIKILPSICYEIAYPDFARSTDPTINFILTVTNDAWFGDSSAKAQHLQMAVMRSLEMARPGLFVSNDGITATITPKGIIDNTLPPDTGAVLNVAIYPYHGLTPWMRNGIDPLLAIILIMFVATKRKSGAKRKIRIKKK